MKRFPARFKKIGVAVGLIVLILVFLDFDRRMQASDRQNNQLEIVSAEGTAVMQTQIALLTRVAFASSTEAVESWAYVEGHWVRVDEHPILVFPAADVTTTPSLQLTATPQAVENWRIWWELFFGEH